jgi:2,5-diketo-D-gluconate reductase A
VPGPYSCIRSGPAPVAPVPIGSGRGTVSSTTGRVTTERTARMRQAPTIQLGNGVAMPAFGLGTWPMDDAQAEAVVAEALTIGYRLVDTAEDYANEEGVGRGLRASGVDRDEVFITTKFNRAWHGEKEVHEACGNSARRLGVEVVDLLLIHWPNPDLDRYVDAWRGMIQLLEDERVRAIGVSNFTPAHIDRLLADSGVAPHVNQVQLEPRLARTEERAYHDTHGIVTESWAPLGKAGALLAAPPIPDIARAHDRTPAQVVLRWHVQIGAVPIPKTQQSQRLRENLDVFDFSLSDDEMQAIGALDGGLGHVTDPDRFGH